MPLKKKLLNIGTMPRFIAGKKLDIWDNSTVYKKGFVPIFK